jgi:ABC-type antimicrobial peptide transport system ATPase subunit
MLQPDFIILMSLSSLDVSIRAQIINLLMNLQEKLGHSLSSHQSQTCADRVHVHEYCGDVSGKLGVGTGRRVSTGPRHPYSRRSSPAASPSIREEGGMCWRERFPVPESS